MSNRTFEEATEEIEGKVYLVYWVDHVIGVFADKTKAHEFADEDRKATKRTVYSVVAWKVK